MRRIIITIILLLQLDSGFSVTRRDCDIKTLNTLTSSNKNSIRRNNLSVEIKTIEKKLKLAQIKFESAIKQAERDMPNYKLFRPLRAKLSPLRLRVKLNIGDQSTNEKKLSKIIKELSELTSHFDANHPSLIAGKEVKLEMNALKGELTKKQEELKTLRAQDSDKR